MELVHLPPAATALLNALHHDADCRVEREAFEVVMAGARRWLAFYSSFTLSDDEEKRLANIACFWNEVEAALSAERPSLDALVPPLYAAIQGMEQVGRERDRGQFSDSPAVNDVLLAGMAAVRGRGTREAVDLRLPVLARWLENVESMYHRSASRLKPEVREAIECGLQALRQGAADAGQPNSLLPGLGRIKSAAGVVHHFLEWDRQDRQRLAERFNSYEIPLVGPELELGLHSARQVDRRFWSEPVRHALDQLLPRLEGWWREQRSHALMPPELRACLLDEVDGALVGLREAIEGLADEEVDRDHALDRLQGSLESLSTALRRAREETWRPDCLGGSVAAAYWEAIEGVLAGTVPDVALLALMHERALPDTWLDVQEPLLAYLSDRSDTSLLMACERILGHVGPSEPVLVPCPACGAETSHGYCPGCGSRVTGTSTWEA